MIDTRTAPYAALVLRVSLGVMFIAHALLKILVFTLPGTAQFFDSVGFPGLPRRSKCWGCPRTTWQPSATRRTITRCCTWRSSAWRQATPSPHCAKRQTMRASAAMRKP